MTNECPGGEFVFLLVCFLAVVQTGREVSVISF